MYGKIEPNPITISGKTGQIKCLYMTGRTMITMYIMWDGSGFPTNLRVVFGSYGDIIMPYVDFFDDMAVYEFGGDPDVTEMLFNTFKTNVGYTIPCTISNPDRIETYSVLEIHVDTPDGGHVRSARVELTYNGKSNLANTDNKGIAVFYGVPTGTEISYTITAAGYNTASGTWLIDTDVEYETEYVVSSPPR